MLKKIVNNISNISANGLAYEVFKQKGVQAFIIDLNKEGQLFAKGIGVNGEVVGYYSLFTSLINPTKGFNKPYNFKDTGEMFRSFKVNVDKTGFTIDADADKLEESGIIDNDKQILGLTDESKIELVKEIIPLFIEQLRKEMFK
jgi:hypothetical protein